MTQFMDFKLHLSVHGGWFVLFLLISIIFTFFIYRWTNPPVSKWLRYLLIVLRTLALIVTLFVLFEPVLRLNWQRSLSPIVAVLADNSASMQLKDGETVRGEIVQNILTSPEIKRLADKHQLNYHLFDAQLSDWKPESDSIKFTGDGTNISGALKALMEEYADEYLRGIILITDGADNLGENPIRSVENFAIPIFTIGVGDTAEPRDILISKIFTNQITYLNNKLPVEVTITGTGYENQRVQVQLKDQKKIIATENVVLSGAALEKKISFAYIPQTEGLLKLEVIIPPLEGEITTYNNRQVFYVNVLKNRMKVLIVAGGPSADYVFLKRTLQKNENIELKTFVEKGGGEFYEGRFLAISQLKEFDCVIFQDFPRRTTSPNILTNLLEVIQQHEIPLLFLAGPGVAYNRLNPLKDIFPVQLNVPRAQERTIQIKLTSEGNLHPVFRLTEEISENTQNWLDLPPIYYPFLNLKTTPFGKVIAEVNKASSGLPTSLPEQPVIVLLQIRSQKVAAVLGYELWRWNFLLAGRQTEADLYNNFFNRMIRWLVTREEDKRVKIQSNKNIYRGGEPVEFQAQVYFEDYRPMENAEVKVSLKNPSDEHEIVLQGVGNGRYIGVIPVLAAGEYEYHGKASAGDVLIGEDTGKFSVEPFSLEFQNTRMEAANLQKIAAMTGGHYFTINDFQRLSEFIKFPPKKIIIEREWELWNKISLLVALLIFLSTEWFVRKKKGML